MAVTIRLLNQDREILHVLTGVAEPRYSRRPHAATEIEVTIPRAGAPAVDRSQFLELWRGEQREATGRIEIRDVSPSTITITAFTEEILLKDYQSPAQYGPVFAGMSASEAIRHALARWRCRRVKTAAEWAASVTRQNVEARDAAGGTLWLARNAEGAYHRNGHAVYQFNSSSFPGFTGWDRIRWASDYPPDGLVFTTIQYRFGTSGPWLPDATWPSYDGDDPEEPTQTLTGERGVMPDQLGLALTGTSSVLQVRVNLYTDDQDSQEEDEEETSGSSPVFFALEVIARAAGPVQAGDLAPELDDVTVQGITADDTEAFDIIRQICEQAEADYAVTDGLCHVAEAFGPDLSGEVNLVT